MKKTIAILLVAIMAVSSVFALDATLSGKFTSKLAYDFEDNWLGFTEPDNALDLTVALSTATENEGDVYAVVKAELSLLWETDGNPNTGAAQNEDDLFVGINNDDSKFEITEAAIYGNGWNLSILKAAEMTKYAKGWETYNDGDDNVDLKAPVSFKDDLGVTFTLDNIFKAGFSVAADFDENEGKNFLAWAATDDLNIAGIVANASVGVTKDAASKFTYVGLGLEAGYENDSLSATVASDMSIGIPTEKNVDATFDLDVAANVNFADMVTVDAYYASQTMLGYSYDATKTNPFDGSDDIDTYAVELDYDNIVSAIASGKMPISAGGRGFIGYPGSENGIEDYLSAKVGFDMNAFDVPVKLTLAAMDLINNPYFDLEAAVTVAGFDIKAYAGYQHLDLSDYIGVKFNNIHVGGEVAYTIDPVGKIFAKTTFLSFIPDVKDADAQNAMSLELGLENTTLVSGATLKAGYKTANIIGGDNALMAQSKGAAYVSATIEF